jgi:CBS domain containing-hemolysin-like protein
MEWLIQGLALLITIFLAIVKSLHYVPAQTSDFELGRLAEQGDAEAQSELQRRHALPALIALQRLKEVLLIALLATILLGTHEAWAGLLLCAVYLLIAEFVAARGWLAPIAGSLQAAIERRVASSSKVAAAVKPFAPKFKAHALELSSRSELQQLIAADDHVFNSDEKARLLGALQFSDHTIAGIMVPRDRIVTVEADETVGAVLLDRLHKSGYNIYPVVKKDLNNLQGLLYMSDILEPAAELKKVKDALRPTVCYLPESAPLSVVFRSSLQSGRQLFIVIGDNGNITGLVTLRDALVKLLGSPPPAGNYLSTDPKKVQPYENPSKAA